MINLPFGYTLVGPREGMIIMQRAQLPHIEKAHKLARTLTLDEIDLILQGKKHLHGNPKRKKGACTCGDASHHGSTEHHAQAVEGQP
jgi:hypothetical protein